MICNGEIMTIINKSAHLSRYSACNLRFIITYSIAIIKRAKLSRYSACNMICNGEIMTIIN